MSSSSDSVWVQLYIGKKKSGEDPFQVRVAVNSNINDLKEAVKEKRSNALATCDAADLLVYKLVIVDNKNEKVKLDPRDPVPMDMDTKEKPLVVVAPAREVNQQQQQQQQEQQHQGRDETSYLVSVRVLGAVRSSGARGNVFKFLEQHLGHFSQEEGIRVIYDVKGNLNATAYFVTYDTACQFQNAMNEWEIHKELVNLSGVEVDPITPQRVPQPSDLQRIRLQDYKPQESESPCQSINQLHSYRLSIPVTEAVEPNTDLARYQSIDKLLPHLKHYRCHLKSKSKFKNLQSDENNMVAASWTFHQLLDGLNTTEEIPLVALSVKSTSDHTISSRDNRFSVTLNLEFFYQETAAAFAGNEGARKVDELNWETVIFVKDKVKFQDCVEWKYKDTKKEWERHRDFLEQE
jgi:Crinkler effector protein N-terminal domain